LVNTSIPPIDKANVGFPVITSEIIMVSMVPMVRHEIDFTILRYDFSLMFVLFDVKKKAPLISRRAYKYLGKNSPIS
jgi:hypothetical protein